MVSFEYIKESLNKGEHPVLHIADVTRVLTVEVDAVGYIIETGKEFLKTTIIKINGIGSFGSEKLPTTNISKDNLKKACFNTFEDALSHLSGSIVTTNSKVAVKSKVKELLSNQRFKDADNNNFNGLLKELVERNTIESLKTVRIVLRSYYSYLNKEDEMIDILNELISEVDK